MSYLAKEHLSQTKIYGIDKTEFMNFASKKKKSNIGDQNTLNLLQGIPKPYCMLKIEIVTSGGLSSYHLLVSKAEVGRVEYKLGRGTSCDIIISQNTISREQCRFILNIDEFNQDKAATQL